MKSLVPFLLSPLIGGAAGSPTLFSRQDIGPNPIHDEGWYADPDAIKVGDSYWIYATVSIAFGDQTWFEAFESKDLLTWTKHEKVFTAESSAWALDSFWAPCTVEKDGKFYLYYTANNPVEDAKINGIGVAVADSPGGPFEELLDHPMVGEMVNNADAMDQQVFFDDDGKIYLIWGGSRVNIAPLNEDMVTIEDWEDGSGPIDISPNEGFGEGSYMIKHNGTYYFMWSEGGYGTPDYRVAYAKSESITGPFNRIGLILSKDDVVADGPGHHSIFSNDEGQFYVAYHRRFIGDDVADNRVLAVDKFFFNEDGSIEPVVMT